jgi:hypothetical protein
MRAVAWGGGVLVVAGLIVMAVAGFPGATPILVSAAALVVMIGLGSAMGGRHTPNVPPVAPGPGVGGVPVTGPPPAPSPGGGTAPAGEADTGADAEGGPAPP